MRTTIYEINNCSTGNYNYNGKESEKEYVYVCITKSLCILETNIAL